MNKQSSPQSRNAVQAFAYALLGAVGVVSCGDFGLDLGKDEPGVDGSQVPATRADDGGANADSVAPTPADDAGANADSVPPTPADDAGRYSEPEPEPDPATPQAFGPPPVDYCDEDRSGLPLPEDLKAYWSSFCVVECGDGILAGAEECDDGNASAGDGCSKTCTVEPGHDCTSPGEPCQGPPDPPDTMDPSDAGATQPDGGWPPPPVDYCDEDRSGLPLPEDLKAYWNTFCDM